MAPRTWTTAEAWPAGSPLPPATGRKSLRFFASGTASNGSFDKLLFIEGLGANPYLPTPNTPPGSTAKSQFGTPYQPGGPYVAGHDTPPPPVPPGATIPITPRASNDPAPQIYSHSIRVYNDNGAAIPLEISFDGTNIHGRIMAGREALYEFRHECGIAVRGVGGTCAFRIEAW